MQISKNDATLVIDSLHTHMAYKVLKGKYLGDLFKYRHTLWTVDEILYLWLTVPDFNIQHVRAHSSNRVSLVHLRNLINSMDEQYIQQTLLHAKLGIPQESQWTSR